ncbi:DNA replication protein psf2 [Saitoella coloradoensis]
MSLPPPLQSTLTPAEISFIAEQTTTIQIIPRARLSPLELISTTTPDLRPPQRAEVPLWLGLLLKKQRRASLVCPGWLSVERLEVLLEKEVVPESPFSELPFRWLEIAQAILDVASDDLQQPDRIRRLIQDLREARQGKAREGLAALNESSLQMDNLGLMEINEIRPFFAKAMDQIRRIAAGRDEDDEEEEDEGDMDIDA